MLAKKAAPVPPEHFAAWLHRTDWLEACHLALSEQRLSRPLPVPEPSAAMNRPDAYDELDAALQTLSVRALSFCYDEELSGPDPDQILR